MVPMGHWPNFGYLQRAYNCVPAIAMQPSPEAVE